MSAMKKVTDPLREFADRLWQTRQISFGTWDKLRGIEILIDAEHERRMRQSRHECRRALTRYLRTVLNDYDHGIKRKVVPRAQRQPVGDGDGIGHHECSGCGGTVQAADEYCRHCGARLRG